VLIARIRAGLRRQEDKKMSAADITFWQQGDIKLNAAHHTAFNGDEQLDLQATEFSLLKHFLSNPEIVFSRNQIIVAIKGPDYPVTDRSVDVQILGLRKKLGKAGDMIETIRGVGYRLRALDT
jgi:two-component system phosphate regulon response regulator PhoB